MQTVMKCLIFIAFFLMLGSWVRAENQRTILDEIKGILANGYLYPTKLSDAEQYPEISGYLAALGDRYTQYYSPEDTQQVLSLLNNEMSGIGAVISVNPGEFPQIVRVFKGSPAEQAGVQLGDLLLAIDGEVVDKRQNLSVFVDKIKGKVWTQVSLSLYRGGKLLTPVITRAKVSLPILSVYEEGEKCLITLNNFDKGAASLFLNAFNKLKSCQDFILDLRDNPGGIVDEVLAMLGGFLPEGTPLLSIQTKDGRTTYYRQQSERPLLLPKTTILINKNSASASEIFAAGLKYYFPDRVRLVWETSHGKGSMQEIVRLSNEGLLKYTMALRYIAKLPVSLNGIGLAPELAVIDDPQTLQDEVLTAVWWESSPRG